MKNKELSPNPIPAPVQNEKEIGDEYSQFAFRPARRGPAARCEDRVGVSRCHLELGAYRQMRTRFTTALGMAARSG